MYEYLQDADFLYKLDREKNKTQYCRITILNYAEEPITDIQGSISSGSVSVNGSAAIRRTINLTMLAELGEYNVMDLDSIIAVDKKVSIWIGYKNPFKSYQKYGDIVWFPMGTYILSSASVSNSTSGASISLQGKDKMAKLDGTCGGTLPASVTFHEVYNYDDNGDLYITTPTMETIIREAVAHYGEEPDNNIFINDMEDRAKLLVKYIGDSPLRFSNDYNSYIVSDQAITGYTMNVYTSQQDVGYQDTDFTYPGELILGAGETVTSLLDKIAQTLGNYEYYYDVWGRFIWQQKRNYQDTTYTPIVEVGVDGYIKNFSDSKYAYALRDAEAITSINLSPKYDNIKNDFIVWGKRKTIDDSSELGIRFHLAIDEKPYADLAMKYMWKIVTPKPNTETGEMIIRYEFTDSASGISGATLVSVPCIINYEWREELYRQALVRQAVGSVGTDEGYYDQELIAEWRKLYDPNSAQFKQRWEAIRKDEWTGWNVDVYENPLVLDYWLDFLDTGSKLGSYSVNKIGRRTKVINDDKIDHLYTKEVPDIIFIENTGDSSVREQMEHYDAIGQHYCLVNSNQWELFAASSTGASAYDSIREMLYQNLNYNTGINITCLPIYYLEPNQLLYIQDELTGIQGEFIITQFTLPLNYSGTMSITATEALTRV